jgi:hypothetical protein
VVLRTPELCQLLFQLEHLQPSFLQHLVRFDAVIFLRLLFLVCVILRVVILYHMLALVSTQNRLIAVVQRQCHLLRHQPSLLGMAQRQHPKCLDCEGILCASCRITKLRGCAHVFLDRQKEVSLLHRSLRSLRGLVRLYCIRHESAVLITVINKMFKATRQVKFLYSLSLKSAIRYAQLGVPV